MLLTILSDFINTRLKKNIFEKEWPDNKMKTKAIRQQAAHTTYHHLPAAQQALYIQNTAEFSGERERKQEQRMDHEQKNDKTKENRTRLKNRR